MNASEVTGNVLRIEKTSMHDGDGLRTVVFLKGCPLRCLWCSTPESQNAALERGLMRERCVGCGRCAAACSNGALSFDNGHIVFHRNLCVGCFECARVCPASAIKVYGSVMSVKQVVREIAKDEIFYFHSGGGVTISGGEPLEQPDFVCGILAGCYDINIHRAMETSFFAPWEQVERFLPLLNLLHVDLKHAGPSEHKRLTGVDNGLILENIRRADKSPYEFDMVLRTPLIPGINDSNDALRKSAEFVRGLSKLRFMEFLAYHRLGTETYKRLDKSYPLAEVKTPTPEHMRERALFFKEIAKVPVRINGQEI